jgi:hypothetical protein
MSLNLPLRHQVPALAVVLAITTLPALISIYRTAEAEKAQQETIQAQTQASLEDTRIGLLRAKTCQIIVPKTPLTSDSKPVTYLGTNRKLPIGSAICDRNGYTAIQGDTSVLDIRPINSTQLNNALKGR